MLLPPLRLLTVLTLLSAFPPSLEAAQAQGATSVRDLRDQAVAHYRERRYFQAIQAAEKALGAAPEAERGELKTLLARFRSALGVELFNAGETRKAEESFRGALEASDDSYARFGLGFLHFVRLDDAKAAEHLEQAARLDPAYAKTHKLLGLVDYRQGRTASALARMVEACRLDPKDREAKALLDRWQLEGKHTGAFREEKLGRFAVRWDPDLAREAVEQAARELEAARKELEASGLAARPVPVVLFTERRFHEATGSFHWVGGVFDGQVKLPLGGARLEGAPLEELRSSLRHELVHVAVREVSPECPNWLNEGIAQHFDRARGADELRRALREGASRRLAFRDVPLRLWEVDDEALSRWTYVQGHGFVEFLVQRFQEFRLRLLLRALAREGSVARAFEGTYGAALDDLEAQWWKEVLGG
ncbi:MAG: tetratricopeptide repeat protein [Planctomycetes bacterium]|nr:tetratricopeptide repeat protein [Planctomycetota bacterium]